MQKKREFHILVITELAILISVLLFIVITKNPTMLGFTIYESSSDGLTINDTYLREQFPDNNFGTSTNLRIGNISGGTEYVSLIKDYNISSISSGDTIVSAKLQFYVNESFGNSNITIKAYRITSDWIESQATWNDKTTSVAWTSAGGDFNAQELGSVNVSNQSGIYYNLTITEAVRGWVNGTYNNYGIILKAPNTAAGNYTYLASANETNTAQKPKFIIEHTANAVPIIEAVSTNSSLTSLIQVGNQVNITVNWTDLESDSGQMFACNSSAINTSGCNETTLCNTSFQSSGPSSCIYTVLSTDNRTTNFWISVCDSNNCSTAEQSQFYINHIPTALVIDPNGGETVNQSLGNYTIEFNITDSDSDPLTANLYYGSTQNPTTNIITSNLNLTQSCTDSDSDTATANNCSYSWNTTSLYGTFFLTIILNDTYMLTTTANDSSDSSFNIRSLSDTTPPNITAQWIDSDIYSSKQIQIHANVSDPNINTVWVSINTTPQTNLTMTNTSATEYNITWMGIEAGNYQFKTWANDTIGNTNNSMSWQTFSITKPNATTQNEIAPSTALPYHTIKITTQLNATDSLRDVYAYLNVPDGFTFLSNYSQNTLLGNFTTNQTKTATWFVSVPITESTYTLNTTYTDYYSNIWNSSNFQIQVTSGIGGYILSVSGYPEVETSEIYYIEADFEQTGSYIDPDSISILIYDATGSLTVGPASMTKESTGIYNYSYTVGASATEGQWESIINATKSSTSYYANEFWKVVGGPFDVRTITIINSDISSLNISVITENTGGANKDLTLTWNLTRIDNNALLDSGSDTFMVPSNSQRIWAISPSTTYVGQVKITFIGYYSNTEKAGAYKTFSTTSGGAYCGDGICNNGESCSTCSQDCGTCPTEGGGGGGGGEAITPVIPEKGADFKIISDDEIYLAKNIEKTVFLEIENTGNQILNNIVLDLGTLNKDFFIIKPIKINTLEIGEKKRFEINFLVSDFIGEYDFKFRIKSDELTKEKNSKIIVTSLEEFLEKEINRLKKRAKEIREKTNDKDILNKLNNCEEIILELESNVKKEEFINAKDNIKNADDCLNNVDDKIQKEAPIAKMEFSWLWIIIILLLILVVIALGFIIYVLYKKIGVIDFLRKKQESIPQKSKSSRELKKEEFNKRIQNIEDKLKS